MVKIAISGKAESGKTTAASYLDLSLNGTATGVLAFADPIKEMVIKMFPESNPDDLYGASRFRSNIIPGNYTDHNGFPLTYRQALLDIGSLGRRYNPNKWIDVMDHRIKERMAMSSSPPSIVVSDMRFINEYEYLKSNGFYAVRILRDSYAEIDDQSEKEQDAIPDDKFDCVIYNNSTIDEFYNQVKGLLDYIKRP